MTGEMRLRHVADQRLQTIQALRAESEVERAYQCHDCQDSGWLLNRVDGKYPCTCLTETEPYRLLKQERDALAKDNIRLRKLMQWFVDRCDNGEVRSRRTYQAFKDALSKGACCGGINW